MLTVNKPKARGTRPPPATVPQLETRYSIARDALVNDRAHRDEAIGQFLTTLTDALAGFRIATADSAPLDARVLKTLARMKPCRDFLLEMVHLAADSSDGAAVHERVRGFLANALAFKQAPRDIITFNHLWCDQYRFALRELYLYTVAVLLAQEQYDEVARYLDADYPVPGPGGTTHGNFLCFDAYIKTLDEFRARRLRLNRLSISTDVLRERSDLPYVSFDDVMQADFVICIRGLLHYPDALNRWFPRTLAYAENFEKSGFDLFFRAQSRANFKAVATVLGVRDKADLVTRFEQARRDCRLDQWRFGGCAIPFDAYMQLPTLDSA